jgi:hypothetical protein
MEQSEKRNIPGYDKDYLVDTLGNIYSKKSGELKKLSVNDDHRGYLICGVKRDDGIQYPLKVHHAVLYAFVGPKPGSNYVGMHIDDDSYNNKLENLKWGTIRENQESKLKNKSKSVGDKRKLNNAKKELVKRMLDLSFSVEDVSILTGWTIKKIEKELNK